MAQGIAIIDSGLGGLTVYREIAALLPKADLLYFADNAAFPYGNLTEAALVERVCLLVDRIMEKHEPEMIVLACNTASTFSLPVLRSRHTIPFVGTVPAIKPAVAFSQTRRISILATPGTVTRDYTRDLIATHAAGCTVDLIGSAHLAPYAEAELHGEPASDNAIYKEIAPAFQESPRTDTIVLACTHYPLLLHRFKSLAPWPVEWIDPAPAIARRVASLASQEGKTQRHAYFTSLDEHTNTLLNTLNFMGFSSVSTEHLPFSPV